MVNVTDTDAPRARPKRIPKGSPLNRILLVMLLTACAIWLILPFSMAVL